MPNTKENGSSATLIETRRDIAGYAHFFKRYFTHEGQEIDRLKQILEHGIVSQQKAEKLGLLFRRELNFSIEGARKQDHLVYLFPITDFQNVFLWDNETYAVLIANDLRVITPERMIQLQEGNWINGSPIRGEVYRFGEVDQSYFREIVVPRHPLSTIYEVREMVNECLPNRSHQIKLSKNRF